LWPALSDEKKGKKEMSEKKDETLYDRIRREARERDAKERERVEYARRVMTREPSSGMQELKGRFKQ
jgi:hypothetical protein